MDAACYKGSKRSIQSTSRRSCQGLAARPGPPAGPTPARPGLQVPVPVKPQRPWPCCPRALAWQKERGERVGAEDGRGGNLSFSFCKFVLAHTTRPHAKRQWPVSLAICRVWSLKGFWNYSIRCNSDHLRPSWHWSTKYLHFSSTATELVQQLLLPSHSCSHFATAVVPDQ